MKFKLHHKGKFPQSIAGADKVSTQSNFTKKKFTLKKAQGSFPPAGDQSGQYFAPQLDSPIKANENGDTVPPNADVRAKKKLKHGRDSYLKLLAKRG
jgi:hypothetical protein